VFDTQIIDAQAIKKQKRKEAFARANDRARQVDGVFGFEVLVRELFDPQSGVSTKKPGQDRSWFSCDSGFPTASRLRRHAERKESLAVTWGPKATVRVIDADAHGCADRMQALPMLWRAIQALHFGREVLLPELVNGRVPEGVQLAGAIITSPNGLHYIERTVAPEQGDCLSADVARVTECLRMYGVPVRPGVIEVLPSPNGQSRLPLGHGCEFVYPALGDVGLALGVELLSDLVPVGRSFPDVVKSRTGWVETLYEGEEVHREMVSDDVEPFQEPDLDEDEMQQAYEDYRLGLYRTVKIPTKADEMRELHQQARKSHKNVASQTQRVETLYEGEEVHRNGGEKSEWVQKVESILENGAGEGLRNRDFWEVCMLLRLTRAYTREQTERRMVQWIETAPHTSKDLSKLTTTKRKAALTHLRRLLNTLDAGLASGRFYQAGSHERGEGTKAGDALLLNPTTPEEIERFRLLGVDFLRGPDGESLVRDLPEWIQVTLPILTGAIIAHSRDGRIALPAETVQEYARTKKAKVDPFNISAKKLAYKILLDCLERFGVVSGIVVPAHKGKRLAAVYETNTVQHEDAQGTEGRGEASTPGSETGDVRSEVDADGVREAATDDEGLADESNPFDAGADGTDRHGPAERQRSGQLHDHLRNQGGCDASVHARAA